MRKFTTRDLTLAAVLAAVYAALTITLPVPQYGAVQIRFAEALTVLPFLFPAATPGLFVGCIIANLFSPFVLDVVFGSMATLLACLWTSRMTSRWLAPVSYTHLDVYKRQGHRGSLLLMRSGAPAPVSWTAIL